MSKKSVSAVSNAQYLIYQILLILINEILDYGCREEKILQHERLPAQIFIYFRERIRCLNEF